MAEFHDRPPLLPGLLSNPQKRRPTVRLEAAKWRLSALPNLRTRSRVGTKLVTLGRWMSVLGAALRLSRSMELHQTPDPADLDLLGIDASVLRLRLVQTAQTLRTPPDHSEVIPGPNLKSICGYSRGGKPAATSGFAKRNDTALPIESEFVRVMVADEPPPASTQTRATNSDHTAAAA